MTNVITQIVKTFVIMLKVFLINTKQSKTKYTHYFSWHQSKIRSLVLRREIKQNKKSETKSKPICADIKQSFKRGKKLHMRLQLIKSLY